MLSMLKCVGNERMGEMCSQAVVCKLMKRVTLCVVEVMLLIYVMCMSLL